MSAEATHSDSRAGLRDPTLSDDTDVAAAMSNGAAGASSAAASADAGGASGRRKGKFELNGVGVVVGSEREGIVYYTVNVYASDGDKWSCQKRFSQFEALHAVLVELHGHRGFPAGADLPPKKLKLFVAHTEGHFIEERRCLLNHYLTRMAKVRDVTSSDVWLDFLSSDVLPHFVEPPFDAVCVREDSEVTGVSIPQTRMMSDHVLYQVDVLNMRKRKTFSKWTVLKRFAQFHEVDDLLRSEFASDEHTLSQLPASPSRQSKLLYDHADPHFIEQRRCLLENYLNKLLKIDNVTKSHNFLTFLGVQV